MNQHSNPARQAGTAAHRTRLVSRFGALVPLRGDRGRLMVLAACAAVIACQGGEETGHARAANAVQLTETMARNLGLETAEATLRPITRTFPALGAIEPDPASAATITSRVPGRVTRVAVREGQRVRGGELLVEIESRVVADPPPRLEFRAPIDGVVVQVPIVAGSAVEPDVQLVTVCNLESVFAVIRVPEGRIGDIQPGQEVRVRPVALRNAEFIGRVESTAAQLDRDTGTLRTFVRIANPRMQLLPGMRVQSEFVTAHSEDTIVVPRAAVLGDGGDLFVFRPLAAPPLAFARIPVVVGLRDDRHVEIIQGVLPGDNVVIRGNYQLQYVGAGAAKLDDDHGHSHGAGGHKH